MTCYFSEATPVFSHSEWDRQAMKKANKHPGQFDAILAMLCLALSLVVPGIFARLRLPFVNAIIPVFLFFWGISWGAAISAVWHGEGAGKTLGVFALVLAVVFNLLLIGVLMPTV